MYNAKRPSQSELPSPAKLLRSTILAAVSGAAILVAVVLPSEYGIDPTGAGRLLGLTSMGETKVQLAAEAEADRKATETSVAAVAPTSAPAPAPDLSGLYQRIDTLEGAVRDLTRTIAANRTASVTPAPDDQIAATAAQAAVAPAPEPAPEQGPDAIPEPASVSIGVEEQQQAMAAAEPEPQATQPNQHEASFRLDPGQGIEVKLVMQKGAQANFAWASEGGPVNFDTHGDGAGDLKISYEKGRGVQSDEGTITAEFDGKHGWFWRNRNSEPVTLTLRTAGYYSEIKGLPN